MGFLKSGSDLRVTEEEPSLPAQGQIPNIYAQDLGEEIFLALGIPYS